MNYFLIIAVFLSACIFGQEKNIYPVITAVSNKNIYFAVEKPNSLKVGDEIIIRFSSYRLRGTEGYAIVTQKSNNNITAKDLSEKAQVNDHILIYAPIRHRLSVGLGTMIPTIGETILKVSYSSQIWTGPSLWKAGIQFQGEYEYFLPHQMISSTAFGVSYDGAFHSYVFTGVAYRGRWQAWEFIPYIRLGAVYMPLSFQGQNNLQGMALRFGINAGLSTLYRISHNFFIGFDIGFQWVPLNFVALVYHSNKISPSWIKNNKENKNFPLTSFYPSVTIKFSWAF